MRRFLRRFLYECYVWRFGADLSEFAPPAGWHEARRRRFYNERGWPL